MGEEEVCGHSSLDLALLCAGEPPLRLSCIDGLEGPALLLIGREAHVRVGRGPLHHLALLPSDDATHGPHLLPLDRLGSQGHAHCGLPPHHAAHCTRRTRRSAQAQGGSGLPTQLGTCTSGGEAAAWCLIGWVQQARLPREVGG